MFCGKVEEDRFSPIVRDLLSVARTLQKEEGNGKSTAKVAHNVEETKTRKVAKSKASP